MTPHIVYAIRGGAPVGWRHLTSFREAYVRKVVLCRSLFGSPGEGVDLSVVVVGVLSFCKTGKRSSALF